MALLGSKKGYSKSDINFFEEFSASARKATQVLAVVVFAGVIIIGITLAILFYDIWRNYNVQKDIDNLNATLASDEYAGLELRSQALQQEINDKNQYYYTLTEMRRVVDETNAATTDIANLIGECIPSDAYVTAYELTGESLSISGCTFSYYDAANITYMLNQSDVFASAVVPSIEEDDSLRNGETTPTNPIDIYYDFNITGNIVSDVVVSVGHYATSDTSVIALSGISSQVVSVNSQYEFTGVNTFTASGVTYTLTSVSINNVPLSNEEIAIIQSTGTITGLASENIEISLFYAQSAVEETTEGEGGAV
jgi:Tfp pilus assembly protein PilN